MGEATANKEYKDRLFNFFFGREENKAWTLSLYNAINHSDYADESVIEFNTLENVLYMGMKNDTSFLVSNILSIYEHQSSYNPNMPLRHLEYLGDLYSGYVKANGYNKYGSRLIKLPTPKFVVFYNGCAGDFEEKILRLSDSFDERTRSEADIELSVRMLNINYGYNKELLMSCRPLSEYSWFIGRIRDLQKANNDLIKSVNLAIEDMPEDYIIKAFIVRNKAEVEGMLDTEYNEQEVMELFKAEAREEGREEGREEERANTERERANTERERARADALEEELADLRAELEALKAKN